MDKILFCILHGSKSSERFYNVTETWAKNIDYIFYSDHEDVSKKTIKVSNNTDYSSNEEKHVNIIKKLGNENITHDWYFFCDDDTFVNVNNLEKLIPNLNPKIVYGSVINCYRPDLTLKYLSGGAGYLISKQIIGVLSKQISLEKTGFADVTLGICLRKLQIPIENIDTLQGQPPKLLSIKKEDIKNYTSFHYIKTKNEMLELYNLCKS